MNEERNIEHLKDVVAAVFTAEHKIIDGWRDRLREAEGLPDEERARVCDEYLTAVAEELLSPPCPPCP